MSECHLSSTLLLVSALVVTMMTILVTATPGWNIINGRSVGLWQGCYTEACPSSQETPCMYNVHLYSDTYSVLYTNSILHKLLHCMNVLLFSLSGSMSESYIKYPNHVTSYYVQPCVPVYV